MKLATHNEDKAKRIILDSLKDHLIPHIAKKKTAKDMFEVLVGLFESSCVSTPIGCTSCNCTTSLLYALSLTSLLPRDPSSCFVKENITSSEVHVEGFY